MDEIDLYFSSKESQKFLFFLLFFPFIVNAYIIIIIDLTTLKAFRFIFFSSANRSMLPMVHVLNMWRIPIINYYSVFLCWHFFDIHSCLVSMKTEKKIRINDKNSYSNGCITITSNHSMVFNVFNRISEVKKKGRENVIIIMMVYLKRCKFMLKKRKFLKQYHFLLYILHSIAWFWIIWIAKKPNEMKKNIVRAWLNWIHIGVK